MQYFQTLHSNEPLNLAQQKICNEPQENERHGQHSRPLDFSITKHEIRRAINKLQNNKSTFSVKIRNEMIKACLDTLRPVYDKFFNSILTLGTMPQAWCGGFITSIYKLGGLNDPANYRGICVSICLKKMFNLFYLKPTAPRTCHVFKYNSQISNWLFTK